MRDIANTVSKQTGVDVSPDRLRSYLTAVGKLRAAENVSVDQLLLELEDVTKRQLHQDLEVLGLSTRHPINISALARTLHLSASSARRTANDVTIAPAKLPTPDDILRQLRGVAPSHYKEAELIETAYEVAICEPELFLLSHGLLSSGRTAYAHQVTEAQKIVESMLGDAIVVHQVGLGKTLTAILVLLELLLRDRDLSSLILIPTNLYTQWSDEIKRATDLPIYAGKKGHYDPQKAESALHLMIPIDKAKEEQWSRLLMRKQRGLLIVDEGHLVRHDDTDRFKFVYSLRARFRLLLTATPIHNSGYDIFHQVNVVRPGLLGREAVFAEAFMKGERHVSSPTELQERLRSVVTSLDRSRTGLRFPTRSVTDEPVGERPEFERQLYDDVLSVLRGIYKRHLGAAAFVKRPSGREQGVSQLVLVAILVLRELASHPLAAIKTLRGPLMKSVARLARLTGDTTDLKELQHFLDKYKQLQPLATTPKGSTLDPKALAKEWGQGRHGKTDALLARLPALVEEFGRVIVYVEFTQTLDIILARLKQAFQNAALNSDTRLLEYHGGLPRSLKDQNVELFQDKDHERAILVSTDSGGQGLNFQKSRVIINFDFPWNPMRVEQRIGRVDRLGQDSPVVFVHNFVTEGTIEQYVYRVLRDKLRISEDVLGDILLPLFTLPGVDERFVSEDDSLGIGQIILSSETDIELERRFQALSSSFEGETPEATPQWQPRRRFLDD